MRLTTLAIFFLFIFAIVIPACGTTSKDAPLLAAASPPIADIPVPIGFTMMKKSISKIIPASSTRFVDHQYSGPSDFLAVVKFYRSQMPTQNWTLIEQTQGNASIVLHFTKGSEDCILCVTDSSAFTPTRIRVRIDPMARNAK
ncbi:MAG: hypothetical protein FWD53_07690 [Phycisphaerales bacterium]|nr:hypothetical protein [Phycisphaerales bacterium]